VAADTSLGIDPSASVKVEVDAMLDAVIAGRLDALKFGPL
jgi:hypothetical protein